MPQFAPKDYQGALNFFYNFRDSSDTFGAYRPDLEGFLQWSWFIPKQSFLDHRPEDIETFIEFCIKPPKSWISLKTVARFIKSKDTTKKPNHDWRAFEASVSKSDHSEGLGSTKNEFQFLQQSIKVMFGILSSFYNYLMQEKITQINPVALIRQKSKFLQKQQKIQVVRRLSNNEWMAVINHIKSKAEENPSHERTLFILSCLYVMYLRIS